MPDVIDKGKRLLGALVLDEITHADTVAGAGFKRQRGGGGQRLCQRQRFFRHVQGRHRPAAEQFKNMKGLLRIVHARKRLSKP